MELNRILKVGKVGDDVKNVQLKLIELGYNIDGDQLGVYGKPTSKAVWRYQVDKACDPYGNRLALDGVVGPMTFNCLFPGTIPSVSATPRSRFKNEIIKVAESQIGVLEVGNNAGKMVNEYQRVAGLWSGAPWCMSFDLWCIKTAAINCGIEVQFVKPRDTLVVLQSGHCQTFRRWAQQQSGWKVTTNLLLAEPGDLHIMVFPDDAGHTGIVKANYKASALLSAVEGNTSDKNIREGDCVASKTRSYSAVKYIIKIPDFLA